jgi:acetyl-CoA acetyltransferase
LFPRRRRALHRDANAVAVAGVDILACGHVAGVCDISSMCDVVLMLQERAGAIQVPIRHGRGLVEAICGGASQSTVAIFERED